jgi:antitoxin FitA
MAILTIRGLDDDLKAKLRLEAAKRGCSMEEAARGILKRALTTPPTEAGGLGTRVHGYFAEAGGFELESPRLPEGAVPDFSDYEYRG